MQVQHGQRRRPTGQRLLIEETDLEKVSVCKVVVWEGRGGGGVKDPSLSAKQLIMSLA